MNIDWKKYLINTPSAISGSIVLVIEMALLGLVIWSGFYGHKAGSLKYAIAAAIGASIAYKIIRHGRLVLDCERVVTGILAKFLCIVGVLLALFSAYFAFITLGK